MRVCARVRPAGRAIGTFRHACVCWRRAPSSSASLGPSVTRSLTPATAPSHTHHSLQLLIASSSAVGTAVRLFGRCGSPQRQRWRRDARAVRAIRASTSMAFSASLLGSVLQGDRLPCAAPGVRRARSACKGRANNPYMHYNILGSCSKSRRACPPAGPERRRPQRPAGRLQPGCTTRTTRPRTHGYAT